MTLRLENPNGQAIRSFGDWLPLAHPPDAAVEWKDFHSAKELARAYFRTGSPSVPEEMAALLNSRPETQGFQIDAAVAGKSIVADTHWAKKRYSDLLLYGQRGQERIVIAVEAVADQPFGDTIDDVLMHGATPDNPRPALIYDLSRAVFGRPIDAELRRLRYQLLHGLAATIIEAGNQHATFAVFVVHEFLSLPLDFDRRDAQRRGLDRVRPFGPALARGAAELRHAAAAHDRPRGNGSAQRHPLLARQDQDALAAG